MKWRAGLKGHQLTYDMHMVEEVIMNAHFWCGNSTIVPSTLPLSVTPYQNLPKWFGAASSFFPRNMSCHSFYSLPKVPEVEWSLKISRKNWPTSANSATSILLMGQIASNFRQVTLTTSVPHPSCLWFLSPPCPEKIHLDHSHSPGSSQRRKPFGNHHGKPWISAQSYHFLRGFINNTVSK